MRLGRHIYGLAIAGALSGAPARVHATDPPREHELQLDELSPDSYERIAELVSALEEEWTVYEMPMLRLLTSDPSVVHPAALESTERSLNRLLSIFDREGSLRASLEKHPIRYIHGLQSSELRALAGLETDGLALWGPRIILSRRLPHAHELVHVVAHLAISSAEVAGVEPLLREGLATYLGGARGRTPSVALAHGDSYLDLGLGDPEHLLGPDRFFHTATDPAINYATAARFVQYLVERHGWEKFGEIYRLLSATGRGVRTRPSEARRIQFEGAYGQPWKSLLRDFHAWRRVNPVVGIEAVSPPDEPAELELTVDGRRLRLWRLPDAWVVQLRAELGYPEVHLQWGERLRESFRPRLRVSTAASVLLRYSLVLRPDGIELADLGFDEILLESSPHAVAPNSDQSASIPREFCVRLPFEGTPPPWPDNPLYWVSPRLR